MFKVQYPNPFTAFKIEPIILAEKTINSYCYIFLFVIFTAIFLYLIIFKGRKITNAITSSSKITALAALFFGLLLITQTIINDAFVLTADYKHFYNKNEAQKHKLLTHHGYYNFLCWARSILPPSSDVDLIIKDGIKHHPAVLLRMRGPYFLVPHFVTKDGPYKIIFQADPPSGKYEYYGRFNNKSYILKKK